MESNQRNSLLKFYYKIKVSILQTTFIKINIVYLHVTLWNGERSRIQCKIFISNSWNSSLFLIPKNPPKSVPSEHEFVPQTWIYNSYFFLHRNTFWILRARTLNDFKRINSNCRMNEKDASNMPELYSWENMSVDAKKHH